MTQVVRFLTIASVSMGGLVACSQGGATVHGLGFEAKDAVYLSVDDSDGNDYRNVIVLISDAEDLCEHVVSGESFAGHAKLAIYSRWTGSAHFKYMQFDNDCGVERKEDTGQGWMQLDQSNNRQVSATFAFIADGTNVTGDVTARNCRLPDNFSYACN